TGGRGPNSQAHSTNAVATPEKWTTMAQGSSSLRRCSPSMATAEVKAAKRANGTAMRAPLETSTLGCWMSRMPATPHSAAIHTEAEGLSRRSGQDRTATQMGKVLVRVSTSLVGSWVRAKKQHKRLRLPAQL